jgi:endoglycosylceramidase
MWEKVVEYFLPEKNVVGYDLINEPTGANAYASPYAYIGPGMNNNKYLLPFYKKVSKAIRRIDKEKFLFFEPLPVDYFGGFY